MITLRQITKEPLKVYHTLESYEQGTRTVATIGTFDGIHVGHKQLLSRVKAVAQEKGGESLLICFHPHPRLVLFPEKNPLQLLQSQREKIAALEAFGLDKVLFVPFTREFSRLSSQAFILDVLIGQIGVKHLVVGHDHHFGKNRTGGMEELLSYTKQYDYTVEQVEAHLVNDVAVSSTKIRQALNDGDLARANAYLGVPYQISGTVVRGNQLGRTLGFPTANIHPDEPLKLIPVNGVYLCEVDLPDGSRTHGLMAIGVRPAVGEGLARTQEVWIMDYDGDLYDQWLCTRLLAFLRPEKKFDSLEALVEGMRADEAQARKMVSLGFTH